MPNPGSNCTCGAVQTLRILKNFDPAHPQSASRAIEVEPGKNGREMAPVSMP